jgi:DNA repair protein RadD
MKKEIEFLHNVRKSDMVELGFWSKLEYQTTGFDSSLLVYNSSKSEYTEESVLQAFNSNNIHAQITQQLNTHAGRKHILVFVPSVAEAIKLSKQYPDSAAIYGDMHKAEREKAINDFRSGKTRVIFNVRVLSTGFDYTGIDCIIFGISTASIALYYQIVGRGTRIDAGKKDCLIIDLAGNVERFGRVEDIYFEKDTLWRMYGTGGKLLSGLPVHELGTVTRDSLKEKNAAATARKEGKQPIIFEIMPFGEHKGELIKNIPIDYRKWVLEKFDWHAGNENLRQSILVTI